MWLWKRAACHFDLGHRQPSQESSETSVFAGLGGGSSGPPGAAGSPAGPGCDLPFAYTVGHYVSLTLGVVGKFVIQAASGQAELGAWTLVSSAILAAVVFPFVYKRVCGPNHRGGMQFFVSFQHGFFFQTILEQVEQLL